nr:ABC transporter permease [uncultured Anaerostipes sp.]
MRFITDVRKYFHYIIFAARSQLRSEVVNSYLDWVWWILEPFCNMLVYTIIFGYVFQAAEPYFPIFLFIGISMWAFFSKTLTASVKLIKSNKAVVTKVYIPKQMLLLKLMAVNAFKMLLSFIIIFIMMLFYRVPIGISVFYALPALLILFIFTYGVSCFLMHYGVYVEDLAYIVTILMSMLMYFTGIFYSIEKRMPEPFGHILSLYNPVACLITVMRNSLLYMQNSSLVVLGIWFLISTLIAACGTKLIYKNENSYVKVI